MKLGIMQSYFFPYIGYFQLINCVDKFIIYEHVSFRKKSWITRNRILDKGNEEAIFINVPINSASSFKNIGEIKINQGKNWSNKILNLIYFNYKKAEHFDNIYPFIEQLFSLDTDLIHDFNAIIIIKICDLLEIDTEISFKNKEYLLLEKDLKNLPAQNDLDIKTQRIIDICKKEKAVNYINPTGGREIYHKPDFMANQIQLNFLETNKITYEQFNSKHEPFLSIIDVLMHNGVNKTKEFLNAYTLD